MIIWFSFKILLIWSSLSLSILQSHRTPRLQYSVFLIVCAQTSFLLLMLEAHFAQYCFSTCNKRQYHLLEGCHSFWSVPPFINVWLLLNCNMIFYQNVDRQFTSISILFWYLHDQTWSILTLWRHFSIKFTLFVSWKYSSRWFMQATLLVNIKHDWMEVWKHAIMKYRIIGVLSRPTLIYSSFKCLKFQLPVSIRVVTSLF